MNMNFQHTSFVCQDFVSYNETTSISPSTGSSSSYSAFPYASFTSDSSVPHTPTALCLPQIQNFSNSDEWSEYSQNEHFQNLWTNDCDPSLHLNSLVEMNCDSIDKKKKSNRTSTYKHIPHREKPVHLVARRNARERKRVQAVNHAFVKLRKVVPVENRNKRLSKVKTLQCAIQYINELERILEQDDGKDDVTSTTTSLSDESPTHFDMNTTSLVYH